MNNLPSSVVRFLSSFNLNSAPDDSERFTEMLARVHGLILIAIGELKNPSCEKQFLDEDKFLSLYINNFAAFREVTAERTMLQILLEYIMEKLGVDSEILLDSDHKVKLKFQDKTILLFPFFIARGNAVWWLLNCRPGSLTYTDFSETQLHLDISHPLFEEAIDEFLDFGWFRMVLKALEGSGELRKKSLENKTYSAHCFLACDLYKAKKYEEAVVEFEKAMRIKSNMPQLFYNLALSYARLGQFRNGIRLLNQLNRVKPSQAKTFELLGDLYSQLSDWERSVSMYQKAHDLAENKLAVTAKLKKLEEKLPKLKQSSDGKKDDEKEDKFSIQNCLQDLTLEAELGNFHPVLGREKELLQVQEILACQSKKNVLVLGDPGVGKTALVQELAYRMISGKLTARLQEKRLVRANIGALLAGAKFRGQFEERLLQLIREAKKINCVLFVDDIHQIVQGGTGKTSSMEASHFFKPALMNDDIQIIGATTLEEFRNTIEKDTSFLRCFQIVKLEEPDNETLLKILRAYRTSLENYHHVIINEESLETTLLWVKVLLRDRALPDKALDVLDRAAARISIQEKSAIVSSESILETISEISNVPLNRMSVSEKVHYRNIEQFLSQRVVGQPQAISTVSRVLCTSKLRMNLNPARPKGIFLFVGPTGVGKTELAKGMTQFLFGHEDKIVRIDMSEYMERYSASRLIGTSPGYVGYYDQNQLVDKIRTNPYSLILLDEIEKADAQLLSIFLQVFDAGRLTDGKGKVAYFDNATIVMTSNVGTHLFAQNKLGYGAEQPEGHVTRSDLLKEVKRFFQPEFLNRIDEIVFFKPLTMEDVRRIALIKLSTIHDQLKQQDKELVLSEKAMLHLCHLGYDYEYGARNLERVVRRYILDKLAELALTEEWHSVKKITAELQMDDIILKSAYMTGVQEIVNTTVEEQEFLEE
jgi:ATP-dependent Clp protease ATP-binding subunit ClpC